MAGCKLIVHADDFGLSENINNGINDAFKGGIVTSTSLVANGAAYSHAVELASQSPDLDIGIHLTLSGETPVLSRLDVTSLVDNQGRFHESAGKVLVNYLSKRICLREVEAEFEAQILKVKQSNLRISHLDGHQHLHVLPKVYAVVEGLARRYNIRAIRVPREKIQLYMFREIKGYRRILEQIALNYFTSQINSQYSINADSFCGFYFGGKLNRANLFAVLKSLPHFGVCELMCHPGREDSDSEYASWGYKWSDELEALVDPEVNEFIDNKGIKLISYRDLL